MSASENVLSKIDAMEKHLALMSKPASSVNKAAHVFAGESPFHNPSDVGPGGWPINRLKALSERYGGNESIAYAMAGTPGRHPRGIGMGPALCKMAELADPRYKGSYSVQQLEKDFGFKPVQKAAMAEASGLTGGYTIPPQFQNQLLTIAAEDSFIEPRATVLPMTTRTAMWPMLDITTVQATGTSPYFGGILGQWQPEAATYNETEPQFKLTEWTAWDLVLYSVSSNQLLADNGIGLDALMTQLFGTAITWYKEWAFINGTGTGSKMPLGILNAPATINQNRASANSFQFSDALKMMSKLQIRSWDNACWIMHQSVLPQLGQMFANAASGDRLVWLNPLMQGKVGPAAEKLPTTFLNGLPIFFTEKANQLGTRGDVILADLSRYVIGNRLDLQVDISTHFLFRNNQLAWRVISRCDGKPWLNSFITDQTGWQLSPFIVLN